MQNKLTSLVQATDTPFSVDGQSEQHMPLPLTNSAAMRGELHPDHVNLQEYEMMLNSPDAGLDRVGMKRNTSIIEKMTNLTYSTVERDNDTSLVN